MATLPDLKKIAEYYKRSSALNWYPVVEEADAGGLLRPVKVPATFIVPVSKSDEPTLVLDKGTEYLKKTLLSIAAAAIGRLLPGYWSIDFARTKAGWWYLIDMAAGEMSWRPQAVKGGSDE